MKFRSNNRPAFTLMELMISMSLLVIILLASSNIFRLVMTNQTNATIDAETQDNIEYVMETITREMRGAQQASSGECFLPAGHFFATNASTTELYFKNSDNQCVVYFMELDDGVGRLGIDRNGYADFISSKKSNINALLFVVDDDYPNTKPLVTVNLKISPPGTNTQNLIIQSSITPRLNP